MGKVEIKMQLGAFSDIFILVNLYFFSPLSRICSLLYMRLRGEEQVKTSNSLLSFSFEKNELRIPMGMWQKKQTYY